MKLISLNVEGNAHLDTVRDFLHDYQADVICLMEAPEDFTVWLKKEGYAVTFAPTTIRTNGRGTFTEGVVLASNQAHTTHCQYYHQPQPTIVHHDPINPHGTVARAVIVATFTFGTLATTHFTWTPNGNQPGIEQIITLDALLAILTSCKPHYLVGDLNIPRHHNPLYKTLTSHYIDTIPESYRSSLDRSFHRLANSPEFQFLFNEFMVDYLLAHPSLEVQDVQLVFGVSDHAAITATIGGKSPKL